MASEVSALRSMLRASHLARPDDMPALTRDSARLLGLADGTIYVIDYDQTVLVPLGTDRSPLAVEGTLAGRAYSDVSLVPSEGSATVWLPLVDGTDRIGVCEFVLGDVTFGPELAEELRDLAALLAEITITRSLYGDAIERVRRVRPMTLPAELQWRLLPPLTYVTPRVAVAGVLAPSTEVAGDSFDYAVNGDVAHVAIVDAMGHGLESQLLSAVAIGALRNARRPGLPLVDTVSVMDAAIADHFGPDKFVTAIVGELDTLGGVWTWVTCGHPPALVVRDRKVVKELGAAVNPPLGLLDGPPEASSERLQPGDRILLYTDGVVEARDATGEFFGIERLVDLVTREAAAGRPVAETLRRLNVAILGHQEGQLQDDATTVVVEWLTPEPGRSTP